MSTGMGEYLPEAPTGQDLYSDEEDDAISVDFIEDQGYDDAIDQNTEFNALVENFQTFSDAPRKENRVKKSVFFAVDTKTEGEGVVNIVDDANSRIEGRGPRGSYYPREEEADLPAPPFKTRQSSLSVHESQAQATAQQTQTQPDKQPRPVSTSVKKTKKKIRHVQIQTRSAIRKDMSVQTTDEKPLPDTRDVELASLESTNALLQAKIRSLTSELSTTNNCVSDIELENVRLREEVEGNRLKFDGLSAQAYRKIKDLLGERMGLDVEVGVLRETVCLVLGV